MRKIGLIGGMSWESTELYYRNINSAVKQILGGHHSAELILESVDFEIIKTHQHRGDWDAAAAVLVQCARNLETAGAEFLLICTNTMHKVAPQVEASVNIPLLHLADATAKEIKKSGFSKVGFIGTKFSMEDDFYIGRLRDKYGLTVSTPAEADREFIHKVIYDELCLGHVLDASREEFVRIMQQMYSSGVECIVEGCTEIVMLVNQSHTDIPLFDTTMIHALEASRLATNKLVRGGYVHGQ